MAQLELCSCCIRCREHCLCYQDCFDYGAYYGIDMIGLCNDCEEIPSGEWDG